MMITVSHLKHMAHCALYFGMLSSITTILSSLDIFQEDDERYLEIMKKYGTSQYWVLFLLRLTAILVLPHHTFNFIGLMFFNAFPGKVKLKISPLLTNLICVRIVTRGDYPMLVQENVGKIMAACLEVGVDKFLIEVVTEKTIRHPIHQRFREIVIPTSYKTKSGAKYKARALQYCLEDDVNKLSDDDYIVHIDEESVLTPDSIRGILNFMQDGRYEFGQGLTTFASVGVENWFLTLADTYRSAEDMGRLRAQFNLFHAPVLNWKGSYAVAKVQAERQVTYDHGIRGSVAEDCYFGMMAYQMGYKFAFIDGEMYEKSAFTILDFIKQRKRWLQGIYLVVHAPEIAWRFKIWCTISLYAWMTTPIFMISGVWNLLFPFPFPFWLSILSSYIFASDVYMFTFGVIKSISLKKLGIFKYSLCIISAPFVVIPTNIMGMITVLWAIFTEKDEFYVVVKDITPLKKQAD